MQAIFVNSNTNLADFEKYPHKTRVAAPQDKFAIRRMLTQPLAEQDLAIGLLWQQTLDNCAISWSDEELPDLGTVRTIAAEIKKTLVYHGPGVRASSITLTSLMDYFLGRGGMTYKEACGGLHQLLKDDPKKACESFQQGLNELFIASKEEFPKSGTAQEKLFKMFVGQLISVIPFLYPEQGTKFSIPVKIAKKWELHPYTINQRIELTPGPFSPLLAFGLTTEDPKAPPLLTFSGTTWGDGRFVSILSDLTPLMSVGHAPYLLGAAKINAWIGNQSKNVQLFGASLGGALCLHTLLKHSSKIASVDIYNSPGLYPWMLAGPIDGPEVNIYMQHNDVVSTAGNFPHGRNVHVYRVAGQVETGAFETHGVSFCGAPIVTMLKSSPAYENSRWERTAWTAILFVTGLTVGAVLWTFFLLSSLFYVIQAKTAELEDSYRSKP